MSGISRDDWLQALAEAGMPDQSIDDQDAITIQEFADMFGIARHTAEHRLHLLEQAGKATRTRKRARARDGRVFSHMAFKLT